ncbi:glycosyltransferase [Algoriphagus machipongonensis]|uniref:Glycosyl transferase n=1 Tax=Algoriphagus machipongonensis TaxID=388413 RepID=A3HT69_9BACT|nr:glycosyltransferase [Algoriphagus machipongonensis]EAZ83037.1 glycosyl transferase [Algoriphagus machipongonensis]
MDQLPDSKIPVLIASSLKPLKDTRAWEKLCFSLRETNKYDLNIIGFSSKIEESQLGIKLFSSIRDFNSKKDRLFSQFRFLKTLLKVRPKLLICCTYEYLPIASFCKPILGYQLIYDVQENYVLNLDLNPNSAPGKKKLAKKIIEFCEHTSAIDHYIFAEKCYTQEMPDKAPFLILENKYAGKIRAVSALDYREKEQFKLLISGTLSPVFGTLEGIHFFKKLLENSPNSSLVIIGHCPIKSYQNKIAFEAGKVRQIELKISDKPIPHQEILEQIEAADFCLLPYQNQVAISSKMPTKLFESVSLGTPIISSKNTLWEEFISSYDAGFTTDFSKEENDPSVIFQKLQDQFFKHGVDEEVNWNSQKVAFQNLIAKLSKA